VSRVRSSGWILVMERRALSMETGESAIVFRGPASDYVGHAWRATLRRSGRFHHCWVRYGFDWPCWRVAV